MTTLYTFIMEFAGGTYISQVSASSLKSACKNWVESIDVSSISRLGNKGKESLSEQIEREIPVPIEGLLNTWCTTATLPNGAVLINIVRTELT